MMRIIQIRFPFAIHDGRMQVDQLMTHRRADVLIDEQIAV